MVSKLNAVFQNFTNSVSIGIIMTSYNRKETTLKCLSSVFGADKIDGLTYIVYLVDDGSSDGTGDAVKLKYPSVQIISGTGNLYWNRGMNLGFSKAMDDCHDFYLWLNDDVFINKDVFRLLMNCYVRNFVQGEIGPVIVGALLDHLDKKNNQESNGVSYAGILKTKSKWIPKSRLVYSSNCDLACDSFLGNCVLIPNEVVSRIGNLDPIFPHAMGDMDYGYRCSSQGIRIFLCKDVVGFCRNDSSNTKLYNGMYQGNWKTFSIFKRLKIISDVKNFPPKGWFVFSFRYLGWLWLLRFARPYVLAIFPGLISSRGSRDSY